MYELLGLFVFIIFTVFFGYHLRLLTISGAVCAYIIGLLVALGIGLEGLLLLGIFFGTSSLWSKFKQNKKKFLEERLEKGSRRDWVQVCANGGIAAFISLLYYIFQSEIWLIGFSISLASANSDTWASEIGSMSNKNPIYIRNLNRTDRGKSGAISFLGTMASICGSFVIALSAYFLFSFPLKQLFIIFLFGFIGNVLDSFLGAFLQAEYRCSVCGTILEKKVHCKKNTLLIKGLSFFNNDVVNLISVLLATIFGMMLFKVIC